jgi:hypothetical protein
MNGQQLRRYVCSSRSTSPTKRSRGLEDAGVELDDLRTTKRHKFSRSIGTESTMQSIVIGPSLTNGPDDYSDGVQIHKLADSADEQGELEEDLVLTVRHLSHSLTMYFHIDKQA